jgi:hypothetical protein
MREIVALTGDAVEGALAAVEAAAAQGLWVAGFLSYEAGHAAWSNRFPVLSTDRALPAGLPLAWFGVFEGAVPIPAATLEAWAGQGEHVSIPDLMPVESEEAFKARVTQIRDLIKEGDVYQVNHTTRLRGHFQGSAVDLYRSVRERQPVGFGGFIRLEEAAILSYSPELFFKQQGRRIETEPMKGTAP